MRPDQLVVGKAYKLTVFRTTWDTEGLPNNGVVVVLRVRCRHGIALIDILLPDGTRRSGVYYDFIEQVWDLVPVDS